MSPILIIKIGFLDFTLWDVFDIAIVGYLIFHVYKLLKGSLAFNIFTILILIYFLWWLVGVLKMDMLYIILDRILGVGLILMLIVFQPEVRRFTLYLGRTVLQRRSNFLSRYMNENLGVTQQQQLQIRSIREAFDYFSKTKTGALMIFTVNPDALGLSNPGTTMDADISARLLETIFQKESPLHDGAVIVSGGKIYSASAVLPVSENTELPASVGLRHRAAVGITEGTKVFATVVSEETGGISYARNGKLNRNITLDELERILQKVFIELQ